jgi:hypothetical protein
MTSASLATNHEFHDTHEPTGLVGFVQFVVSEASP